MPEYSAVVVSDIIKNDVTAFIDVRPPFIPTEYFLRECGAFETELEHVVTTASTTRLQVHDVYENMDDDVRAAAFSSTARYIASALNAVDRGEAFPDSGADEYWQGWPEGSYS